MSQLELSNRLLTLHRFPQMRAESPLQAWDAADEYLLRHCAETPSVSGTTLIFNDAFGALACALAADGVYSITDSWLSQQATRHNLAHNQLAEDAVQLLDSLAELPVAPARVLIKVPRSLALLEQQLRTLCQVLTPETEIVAAGKAKDIHTSTLQLFEKIIGPTTTSLAWKKARLIHAAYRAPALADSDMVSVWPLDGTNYQIHNHAGVFSRSSLDIGARLFMQHLPQGIDGDIVDLGCGNGVIGLLALQHNPHSRVHFTDESWMAVASSRLNVASNRPDDLARCEFHVNNALAGWPADSLQAVLCNPPFHQQSTITTHIAWQMFRDAQRCLQRGGELRIVCNRHLDYFQKLKKLFGNCTMLATDKKFVVLRSVKLR